MHYLEHASNFLERLENKIGKWTAKEMAEVRRRAAQTAGGGSLSHTEPSICTVIGASDAFAGLALALAPETGGASAIVVGVIGVVTGVGSASNSC